MCYLFYHPAKVFIYTSAFLYFLLGKNSVKNLSSFRYYSSKTKNRFFMYVCMGYEPDK